MGQVWTISTIARRVAKASSCGTTSSIPLAFEAKAMQCYLSTSLPLLQPVPNGKLMVMAHTAPTMFQSRLLTLQYSAATISALDHLLSQIEVLPLPSLPILPLSLTLPLPPFPSHTPGPVLFLILKISSLSLTGASSLVF